MLGKIAPNTARREVGQFIEFLAEKSSTDVATFLCVATHQRNNLESDEQLPYIPRGHSLLRPYELILARPQIFVDIQHMIRLLKREGKQIDALAMSIWQHTVRCSSPSHPELRLEGKRLWAELQRGLPRIEEAKASFREIEGIEIDTQGVEIVPAGLRMDDEDAVNEVEPARTSGGCLVLLVTVLVVNLFLML